MSLTPEEIERYYNSYFPYNIRMFVCYSNYTRRPQGTKNKDYTISAMFVTALIKGKMLLETIGITLNMAKTNIIRYNPASDAVTSRLLGGKSADSDLLRDEDVQLLVQFLNTVEKGTMHYAKSDSYKTEMQQMWKATDLTMKLLGEHLYDGREFDWYQNSWGKWRRKTMVGPSSVQLRVGDMIKENESEDKNKPLLFI